MASATRSFSTRILGALAALALAAGSAAPAKADPRAEGADDPCGAVRDQAYADGLKGGPRSRPAAFAVCADAAFDYEVSYRAGLYVGGHPAPPGPAPTRAAPSGLSDGAAAARRRDRLVGPGRTAEATRRYLRCREAATRLGGRAGAPLPSGCQGLAPALEGLEAGRRDRRQQSDAFASQLERNRLRVRRLSPSVTPAEKRLMERRLRALDRADARRAIRRAPN